ncbi:MAG TPA: DUF116 domain-containing protein [Nitrospirota bacterium]|nr:DUF116 domain-containing protein [Nitrospirota bacterium]
MTAREGTIPIISVTGKTYSLFGNEPSTENYYRKISTLADRVLEKCPDILDLVKALERASRNKRFLKKQLRTSGTSGSELIHFVVTAARDQLAPHTTLVNAHLQELSFLKRWDGTLFTSEEQYHLYMLLVELANRAWKEPFRTAKRKIAFLPYCLRDLGAQCRSGPGELDYVCKGCSKDCFVNRVSALLRGNRIEPYLWMNSSLKSLLRELRDSEGRIGVLGVACVPELLRGIQLCIGLNVPVVGIPLNVNRCMRWMGAFHPTSVDFDALNKLVGDSQTEYR